MEKNAAEEFLGELGTSPEPNCKMFTVSGEVLQSEGGSLGEG